MMLQVGRFYRTRNGKKVGPMMLYGVTGLLLECDSGMWYADGRLFTNNESDYDIVEEWKDGSND